jgi:hypothetical protein
MEQPVERRLSSTTLTKDFIDELGEKMAQIALDQTAQPQPVVEESPLQALEEKCRRFWHASCMTVVGTKRHFHHSASVSVDMLLAHYTSPEIMSGCNKFACANCNRRLENADEDDDRSSCKESSDSGAWTL